MSLCQIIMPRNITFMSNLPKKIVLGATPPAWHGMIALFHQRLLSNEWKVAPIQLNFDTLILKPNSKNLLQPVRVDVSSNILSKTLQRLSCLLNHFFTVLHFVTLFLSSIVYFLWMPLRCIGNGFSDEPDWNSGFKNSISSERKIFCTKRCNS